MGSLRFFAACAVLSLGRLRRQLWLLAGLALLCLLLPLGAGRAAEGLLSQGVGFHGVTLAIAAPLELGTLPAHRNANRGPGVERGGERIPLLTST